MVPLDLRLERESRGVMLLAHCMARRSPLAGPSTQRCGFAIEREPQGLQRAATLDTQVREYGFSEVLYLGAGQFAWCSNGTSKVAWMVAGRAESTRFVREGESLLPHHG